MPSPRLLADAPALSSRQRALLDAWLPGATVVADHSWGLVSTRVLQVEHAGQHLAVKASSPQDRHLPRELRAHREWLGPWRAAGVGPELVHADEDARVLVTRWLPGRLVLDTPAQDDPDTYRQAGRLLRTLHQQETHVDQHWMSRQRARVERHLAGTHRIAPDTQHRLRHRMAGWTDVPVTLVPTHGDWQPRNWLTDDDVVRVIDLGRADLRPAEEDFVRLDAQDFARDPALEEAFVDGYGTDPRTEPVWSATRLAEAVGTAAWAYQVSDEAFEAQGHRMLARALAH